MTGSISTADVAVVGLGAFGSATLYHLAKLGVRAVGIDRYAPPHTMGSTHGESRITRLAVGEGEAYAPLVRRSHALWREIEQETGADLLTETGGLILAPAEGAARHHGQANFVRRTIAVAESAGVPHEVLDAAEITARFPQFRLRGDEIGYFEPTAGLLSPERCVAAQLGLAERLGASVRVNERVVSIEQRGRVVRIVSDLGTIEAGRCVVTAGPWLAALLPMFRPVTKVCRQALHWFQPVDPAAFAPGRFPIFIWMHGAGTEDFFYGFPVAAGASDVKVATEQYASVSDPEQVDRVVDPRESTAMFAEHVAGRLIGLTDQVTRAASCLYTVTPDAGFVVDALPGMELVVGVSACSGHGFKHSAAVGEAVAGLVAGGGSRVDLAGFGLARFGGGPC